MSSHEASSSSPDTERDLSVIDPADKAGTRAREIAINPFPVIEAAETSKACDKLRSLARSYLDGKHRSDFALRLRTQGFNNVCLPGRRWTEDQAGAHRYDVSEDNARVFAALACQLGNELEWSTKETPYPNYAAMQLLFDSTRAPGIVGEAAIHRLSLMPIETMRQHCVECGNANKYRTLDLGHIAELALQREDKSEEGIPKIRSAAACLLYGRSFEAQSNLSAARFSETVHRLPFSDRVIADATEYALANQLIDARELVDTLDKAMFERLNTPHHPDGFEGFAKQFDMSVDDITRLREIGDRAEALLNNPTVRSARHKKMMDDFQAAIIRLLTDGAGYKPAVWKTVMSRTAITCRPNQQVIFAGKSETDAKTESLAVDLAGGTHASDQASDDTEFSPVEVNLAGRTHDTAMAAERIINSTRLPGVTHFCARGDGPEYCVKSTEDARLVAGTLERTDPDLKPIADALRENVKLDGQEEAGVAVAADLSITELAQLASSENGDLSNPMLAKLAKLHEEQNDDDNLVELIGTDFLLAAKEMVERQQKPFFDELNTRAIAHQNELLAEFDRTAGDRYEGVPPEQLLATLSLKSTEIALASTLQEMEAEGKTPPEPKYEGSLDAWKAALNISAHARRKMLRLVQRLALRKEHVSAYALTMLGFDHLGSDAKEVSKMGIRRQRLAAEASADSSFPYQVPLFFEAEDQKHLKTLCDTIGADRFAELIDEAREDDDDNPTRIAELQVSALHRVQAETSRYSYASPIAQHEIGTALPIYASKYQSGNCLSGLWVKLSALLKCGFRPLDMQFCHVNRWGDGHYSCGGHAMGLVQDELKRMFPVDNGWGVVNGVQFTTQFCQTEKMGQDVAELFEIRRTDPVRVKITPEMAKMYRFHEDMIVLPLFQGIAAEHMLSVALTLENEGKMEEAKAALELALTYNPCHPAVFYHLGLMKFNKNDYQGAQNDFDDALSNYNDHLHTHLAYGELCLSMGDAKQAKHHFDIVANSPHKIWDDERGNRSMRNHAQYYLSLSDDELLKYWFTPEDESKQRREASRPVIISAVMGEEGIEPNLVQASRLWGHLQQEVEQGGMIIDADFKPVGD